MEREVKIQQNQQLQNQLRELHQEDAQAGGEFPPFNKTESRIHHQEYPAWAGERQSEFGPHRRGPTRRR